MLVEDPLPIQMVDLVVDLTEILLTLLASLSNLMTDLLVVDNLLQELLDMSQSRMKIMMEYLHQYPIFATVVGAELNTQYSTANTGSVVVNGINITVPCNSTNADQIIKNGSDVGTSTTVVNGDTLGLKMTSANAFTTGKTATLTFGQAGGTVSSTWNIITKDQPINVPNAFDFTDVTDQPLNYPVTSNAVTISGLTTTANVNFTANTGGALSTVTLVIDGTDTGSNTGSINNGQTLALRATTSSVVNTNTTVTGTVGGSAVVRLEFNNFTCRRYCSKYF